MHDSYKMDIAGLRSSWQLGWVLLICSCSRFDAHESASLPSANAPAPSQVAVPELPRFDTLTNTSSSTLVGGNSTPSAQHIAATATAHSSATAVMGLVQGTALALASSVGATTIVTPSSIASSVATQSVASLTTSGTGTTATTAALTAVTTSATATATSANSATATASGTGTAKPPKKPGLLSPSLFGSGRSSATATEPARRRTTTAPTRPGVK